MSSRQRKRLEGQIKSLKNELAEETSSAADESSEEDAGVAVKMSAFAGFESSDDESSSDEAASLASEDEEGEPAQVSIKPQKPTLGREAKRTDDFEDLAILDAAIAENEMIKEEIAQQGHTLECYAPLFDFDGCAFDYDVVVSRRFGKFASVLAGEGESSGSAGVKKRVRGVRAAQTQIFGRKDSWPKPPSFAAGGLGQALSEDGRYAFEESLEWKKQNALYGIVKDLGDVNRAVLFLMYCCESHPECLLMLGRTFALYGLMERSLDMVRRALHTYEVAALGSFFGDSSSLQSRCRLDWRVPLNAPLFTALFRYMTLVGQQGYHRCARDTARLLLSLSLDDPMCVLLALDHYLVQCNDEASHALFFGFMGVTCVELEEGEDKRLAVHWDKERSSFPLALSPDSPAPGEERESEGCVSDLPGWWYSLALIEEQRAVSLAKEGGHVDSTPDMDLATSVLAEAVVKSPHIAVALIDNTPDLATSSKQRFQELRGLPPFVAASAESSGDECAEREVEHKEDTEAGKKLAELYVSRNTSLWQSRTRMLIAGAERATQWCAAGFSPASSSPLLVTVSPAAEKDGGTAKARTLLKYAAANLENFAENNVQFPLDANPLDPQLADERVLEPMGIAQQRQHLRRVAAEHFPGAGGYDELVQQQLLRGLQQVQDPWGMEGAADEFGMGPREMELLQRQMEEAMAMEREGGGVAPAQPEQGRFDGEAEQGGAPDLQAPEQQTEHGPEQAQVEIQDLQAGTFMRSGARGLAGRGPREVRRLDYSAPLMQLLLQSFFMPWFQL